MTEIVRDADDGETVDEGIAPDKLPVDTRDGEVDPGEVSEDEPVEGADQGSILPDIAEEAIDEDSEDED